MADTPSSTGALNLQLVRQEFLNSAKNIESARFLKRILQKTADQYVKINKTNAMERAHFFTGLDKRIFPMLNADIKITELKEINRSTVYECYVTFYLNALSSIPKSDGVPTTKNLFTALFGKIPQYVDIRTFRKCLVKMGFGWLRLGKGFIVIEKPEVTFERYYYLKDIVRYREENREIFYVDETVLTNSYMYYDLRKYNRLMKSANEAGVEIVQKGLLKNIYAVSKTGVYAYLTLGQFTADSFENWIINDLLPALPPRSVVVVKNIEHHDNRIKKPTLYSIKEEMFEWLDRNNVPYDENMSKCELVSLIDTYTTEADEICKIESILKMNGHDLLRLPFSIEETTPAKFVFDLIKLNAPSCKLRIKNENGLRGVINSISEETCKEYDQYTAEFEKDSLQIDLRMDEIFDDVIKGLQKSRFDDKDDSEVPLSDSD